jgi:hypothetical protein
MPNLAPLLDFCCRWGYIPRCGPLALIALIERNKTMSLRAIAKEMRKQGISVSAEGIRKILMRGRL